MESEVQMCNRINCALKSNVIKFPMFKAVNDESKEEETIETYEEIPIVGTISRREIMRKK